MNKRIGILTLQYASNYGAQLQAWALRSYLNSIGNQAEVLNYCPKKLTSEYSLNPFKNSNNLRGFVKNSLTISSLYIVKRKFNKFMKMHLELGEKIRTRQDLEKRTTKLDCVIFGSDQIWNDSIVKADPVYFGNFNTATPKYAYSASLGVSSLSNFQKNEFSYLENRFSLISVREKTAKRLLCEIGIDCPITVDPVFLLDKDFWVKAYKSEKINTPNKRYILYYSLQKNNDMEKLAMNKSDKEGLEIVCIHPTNRFNTNIGKKLYNVGPLEFLALIHNAEYICTNSFHAIAFSMIFNRKIISFSHSTTGSRVKDILKYYVSLPDHEYDFSDGFSVAFSKHISESVQYINTIIND